MENLKALIATNLKTLENIPSEEPILLPLPKHIEFNAENFVYSLGVESFFYYYRTETPHLFIGDINDSLSEFCALNYSYEGEATDLSVIPFIDRVKVDDITDEEGYGLIISHNIIFIYAISDRGLFYGVQTLIQILKNGFVKNRVQHTIKKEQRDNILVPEIEIFDYPDLGMRGVTEDIIRGQMFTLESAKRFIRIFSHYKLNAYCPTYMQDMIINPDHPKLDFKKGAMSIKEYQELDRYAKERFVNLFPIYNCIGHQDNICMVEDYWDIAEFPGSNCLDVSNPKIYDFLESYFDKLSKAFSSNWFHIGCDESFDMGFGKSRELVKRQGKGKTLFDFYNKIYELMKSVGKEKIVMYHDIPVTDKNILENLTKDMILMYWNYAPKEEFKKLDKMLDAGFKVIVSPGMLSWCRNFPDNINAWKNTMNFTKQAIANKDRGVIGMLNSNWEDQHAWAFRENTIFGGIMGAAISWNRNNDDYEDIVKNYGFLFYGIEENDFEKFFSLFNTLSSTPPLYKKITILMPPLFFTYLFKHPFTSEKIKPPFKQYVLLGKWAEGCMKLCDELQGTIKFENNHFDYIKYGAELAQFLSAKISSSIKISETLRTTELDDSLKKTIISQLKALKKHITYLKKRYEELWLCSAQRPCIEANLAHFDLVIKAYQEKIEQLKNNIKFENPYIPSEWIWVKESKNPQKPRYFRKVIEIDQKVKKAVIQGIAGNFMEIYVNGEPIGTVLSRFSLHIIPITQRVKAFDITKLLKKGKNIIGVKGINYIGYKGCFNLYGQIQYTDGTIQEIKSDKTWLSYKKREFVNIAWAIMDIDESGWKPAKSLGRPPKLNGDIIKPDLLKGECSLTQDYFGMVSYFYSLLRCFGSERIANIVRFVLNFLLKKINVYG